MAALCVFLTPVLGRTVARRAKQASAIHRWKPWEQNPEVKTTAGKSVSKMNALKHGARSAWVRQLSVLMRRVEDALSASRG